MKAGRLYNANSKDLEKLIPSAKFCEAIAK